MDYICSLLFFIQYIHFRGLIDLKCFVIFVNNPFCFTFM